MATIPVALRVLARLTYQSLKGVLPADDGVDLDDVDLDSPPPTIKQMIIDRIREILAKRQEWLGLTDAQREGAFEKSPLGILRPSAEVKPIKYVQGLTMDGLYHHNFSSWVFVNCDLSKAEFLNCNFSRAIFFGCTQVDAGDPTLHMNMTGRLTNMSNCVGVDQDIVNELAERCAGRIAYNPPGCPPSVVGWKRLGSRVNGLGIDFTEDEPADETTETVSLGEVRTRVLKKVAGNVVRALSDMTTGEE